MYPSTRDGLGTHANVAWCWTAGAASEAGAGAGAADGGGALLFGDVDELAAVVVVAFVGEIDAVAAVVLAALVVGAEALDPAAAPAE